MGGVEGHDHASRLLAGGLHSDFLGVFLAALSSQQSCATIVALDTPALVRVVRVCPGLSCGSGRSIPPPKEEP